LVFIDDTIFNKVKSVIKSNGKIIKEGKVKYNSHYSILLVLADNLANIYRINKEILKK
jgi:hypothetical protein